MALTIAISVAAEAQVSIRSINEAEYPTGRAGRVGAGQIAKAQILLDRARFSPGVIDGIEGEKLRQAIAAFKQEKGVDGPGRIDEDFWKALSTAYAENALFTYTITKDDVRGPYIARLPTELVELADMKALEYTGTREMLAERFHMAVDLLEKLNPKVDFEEAGTEIVVAKVGDDKFKEQRVATIEVDKTRNVVRALDKEGKLLAFYPASVGSKERPAPDGETTVTRVVTDPNYTYDPEYAWEKKIDRKVVVQPGPNNPVGTVWIELEKGQGFGIHGTPEPDEVGKTASHGCVRLTNWDAQELASGVRKGVKVVFVDDGKPTAETTQGAYRADDRSRR